MRAVALAFVLGFVLPLAGCNDQKPTPPPSPANRPAVETHAPGVDVKAEKGNVEVKAPGVDVEIERNKNK